MNSNWQVEEGSGWIAIPGFGQINPRRDNVDGGRQYFTAMTIHDEYAKVAGDGIDGGPETWYFEFDQPFLLGDRDGAAVEVEISLLAGGRYAVKYRDAEWPEEPTGGW